MKEHLVNLLYEDFKFHKDLETLESVGLTWYNSLTTWDIVIDIIGFPKDNTVTEPDYNKQYCRDWLYNRYYNITKIFKYKSSELKVKAALGLYIDWAYNQLKKSSDGQG